MGTGLAAVGRLVVIVVQGTLHALPVLQKRVVVRTSNAFLLPQVINQPVRTTLALLSIEVEVFRVVALNASRSTPVTAMRTLTLLTLRVVDLRGWACFTIFCRNVEELTR